MHLIKIAPKLSQSPICNESCAQSISLSILSLILEENFSIIMFKIKKIGYHIKYGA